MTYATKRADGEAVLREQLAAFRPLLALSMVMTGTRDEIEILRIVTTAVPSMGGGRAEAVHRDKDWQVVGPVGRPVDADALGAQLAALDRSGGRLEVEGAGWAWAYPLVSPDDMGGPSRRADRAAGRHRRPPRQPHGLGRSRPAQAPTPSQAPLAGSRPCGVPGIPGGRCATKAA
jgi:hypothetical protein